MNHFAFILLTTLSISGCELDFSNTSNDPDYKAELIGTWRNTDSTNTHYLKLTQESFQRSTGIESISCKAITFNAPYQANKHNLVLEGESKNYLLTEDTLTLTDNKNISFVYQRISDSQLDTCNSPELAGVWESAGDFIAKRSTLTNNQYKTHYERDVLSCFKKDNEWGYAAHNGKIAIKGFTSNSEPDAYQHTFDYNFSGETLRLYYIKSDPNKIRPEELIKVIEPPTFCEDETSTKEVSVKITFSSLPDNLESHLKELGGEYNTFDTKLTFDMDHSASLSTKDIVLGLRSESKIKADGSLIQITQATLTAKVVDGPTSYDYDFNLERFTMNDNVIAFTAKAADIAWINDITLDTPINVASEVAIGTRITEGEDNFKMSLQHADYYPAEKTYTSGISTGLLEDPINDIKGTSGNEVIVDIQTVEITISE